MTPAFHPLDPLSQDEVATTTSLLRKHLDVGAAGLRVKVIDLFEPPKYATLAFLRGNGPRPDRKSRVYYLRKPSHVLVCAVANITSGEIETNDEKGGYQGPVDWVEYDQVNNACNENPEVLEEIAKLKLPPNARIVNDPWAYGTDDINESRRLFQCYMYVALNDDPQANHYSTPLPLAPIFDADTLELVHLQKLPTGLGPEIEEDILPWEPTEAVEYSADLLPSIRKDVCALHVSQPEGPSFTIDNRTVFWQKWKFQLGWNLREGPVLHDVQYDSRPLFYRVSMSEMTVPYGDPRSPYHRKQAFDLGDSGFGLTSNSLELGCDCLGHIAYFDGIRATAEGDPVVMKNVVCMHEIDQGIGFKHTNWRNGATTVVRDRQLVIQCTATVANYEYILAFVLDQAANLHVEVKATGIVSTMPIRRGIDVPWGNVVAPGVLAVNHQHLFCVRVDPDLDGEQNSTVVYDDCVAIPRDEDLDPYGCAFEVHTTPVTRPGGYELDLSRNRTFKIINGDSQNLISGKPRGYKLHALPSQMMMMGHDSIYSKRGRFATKPIWVTRYQDDELWAAGEFTNQSKKDTGLELYAGGDEGVQQEDVVLWHTFGVTHVTRPEDFPIMPVEKMTISLKPSHFFDSNPSNDVPRSTQRLNQSALHEPETTQRSCCAKNQG